MYGIAFTDKQLDLIGECVLAQIIALRKTAGTIDLSSARALLQGPVDELNEILTILADATRENE